MSAAGISQVAPLLEGFLPTPAKITKVVEATKLEKIFTLEFPDGTKMDHLPCQFVMVSIFGFGEAPISICSGPDDDQFQICVRKVGSLTGKIHELNVGDVIGVRGPYGNGFPVEVLKGKDLLFVAGGLGLAPLRSLIHYVLKHRDQYNRFILLYGSKKPEERLFTNELDDWEQRNDVEFYESVDIADPEWEGNIGLITSLFKVVKIDPEKTLGFMVGPPIMYKFVLKEMQKKKLSDKNIYADLERRMRCGLGKCGHCQMNEVYVCQKGPVFNYSELTQMKEAL